MKKSLVLGILGLATAAVSSYGQGAVFLDNYALSTFNPVVLSDGVTKAGGAYTVQLYYDPTANANITAAVNAAETADGSHIADPTTWGLGLVAATGPGSTAAIYSSPALAGYFSSAASFLIQPGSLTPAQGSYTMVVVAYDGASYIAAASNRGYSAAVYGLDSAPSIPNGSDIGTFFPNGTSAAFAPMVEVHPIPEPTTLALGGLGGLAMLLMRRKKA